MARLPAMALLPCRDFQVLCSLFHVETAKGFRTYTSMHSLHCRNLFCTNYILHVICFPSNPSPRRGVTSAIVALAWTSHRDAAQRGLLATNVLLPIVLVGDASCNLLVLPSSMPECHGIQDDPAASAGPKTSQRVSFPSLRSLLVGEFSTQSTMKWPLKKNHVAFFRMLLFRAVRESWKVCFSTCLLLAAITLPLFQKEHCWERHIITKWIGDFLDDWTSKACQLPYLHWALTGKAPLAIVDMPWQNPALEPISYLIPSPSLLFCPSAISSWGINLGICHSLIEGVVSSLFVFFCLYLPCFALFSSPSISRPSLHRIWGLHGATEKGPSCVFGFSAYLLSVLLCVWAFSTCLQK